MKRLITARDIEDTARSGRSELTLPEGTIVTPLAVDTAKELGVMLRREPVSAGGQAKACRRRFSEGEVRTVVRRVLLAMLPGAFSPTTVEEITKRVLRRLEGG